MLYDSEYNAVQKLDGVVLTVDSPSHCVDHYNNMLCSRNCILLGNASDQRASEIGRTIRAFDDVPWWLVMGDRR